MYLRNLLVLGQSASLAILFPAISATIASLGILLDTHRPTPLPISLRAECIRWLTTWLHHQNIFVISTYLVPRPLRGPPFDASSTMPKRLNNSRSSMVIRMDLLGAYGDCFHVLMASRKDTWLGGFAILPSLKKRPIS